MNVKFKKVDQNDPGKIWGYVASALAAVGIMAISSFVANPAGSLILVLVFVLSLFSAVGCFIVRHIKMPVAQYSATFDAHVSQRSADLAKCFGNDSNEIKCSQLIENNIFKEKWVGAVQGLISSYVISRNNLVRCSIVLKIPSSDTEPVHYIILGLGEKPANKDDFIDKLKHVLLSGGDALENTVDWCQSRTESVVFIQHLFQDPEKNNDVKSLFRFFGDDSRDYKSNAQECKNRIEGIDKKDIVLPSHSPARAPMDRRADNKKDRPDDNAPRLG